jgi:aminodeoxyfutalosine synthase
VVLKRHLENSPLRDLYGKVMAGERLTDADALRLFESDDLFTLGAMADHVRTARHGDATYYNINRHIDYTNVCMTTCKFCAFSRFPGEAGAWELSHEQIAQKAREARAKEGITELHIVGGLHPDYPLDWYEGMLRALKAAVPTVHLKCFTAVEIHYFAEKFDLSHAEVLGRLKAAGLDSMPGGGAEIFHPDVRGEICPGKADADQWIAVHRAAHGLGLKTNATMLYGHVETYAHRVDHMRRLRELQDETGGFQTFIPLAFHPDHTAMDRFARPSGVEDLKTLAVGRLYLDNFPHVKAYWVMLGIRLAQLSLAFGVDDLDGTVMEETIYHMAGADTPQALTVAELQRLIREVGRTPVERDTLYKDLKPQPVFANA